MYSNSKHITTLLKDLKQKHIAPSKICRMSMSHYCTYYFVLHCSSILHIIMNTYTSKIMWM